MQARCLYDRHEHRGTLQEVVEAIEECRDSYLRWLQGLYRDHETIVAYARAKLDGQSS